VGTGGTTTVGTTTFTYTPTAAGSGGFTVNNRFIPLTIVSDPYWMSILGTTTTINVQGLTTDTSAAVYQVGYTGSTNYMLISKYDSLGVIQWQKTINSGASYNYTTAAATDSTGNIFTFGTTNINTTTDFYVIKWNTSGAIQWQRRLGGSGASYATQNGIATDTTGNVYIGSQNSAPGFTSGFLAKYNNSGTIQWQKYLGLVSTTNRFYAIAVDASANIFASGYTNSNNGDVLLAKYNTSGALQFQQYFGFLGSNSAGGIAVDSSGNFYIGIQTNYSGTNDLVIAKFNTSGVNQWQRRLANTNAAATSVTVDSSGNVYLLGGATIVAKWNTSGTIQWQRKLTCTSGVSPSLSGAGIYIDSQGNIGFNQSLTENSTNYFDFIKLPADGTKTGTFTAGGLTFTYLATTYTEAASALSGLTTVFTDGTSTLTDAATTFTATTSTLTTSTTYL